MYGNATAKGVKMDGRQPKRIESDRPIAKPNFPLPTIFNRSVRSESPTLRKGRERAHFYPKQTSEAGSRTYGFYIETEPVELQAGN